MACAAARGPPTSGLTAGCSETSNVPPDHWLLVQTSCTGFGHQQKTGISNLFLDDTNRGTSSGAACKPSRLIELP
ncbi:hypothetical protein WJX74_008638 [Apatococcus lobatus]|uniref:Secreted protein n=1 Tax=Apatococcus lobatus TaxID=904363 RepID=A0AAW1RN78_9CHLO